MGQRLQSSQNWANRLMSWLAVAKILAALSQRNCKYCGFGWLGFRDFHHVHVWMQIMTVKPARQFLSATSEMKMFLFPSEVSWDQSYPMVGGLHFSGQCCSCGVETK